MFGAKRVLTALSAIVVATIAGSTAALAQPTFSSSFSPSTIAPGSQSQLSFQISNGEATPATGMAFTNTLPAGVTIADAPEAATTCLGGIVTIGGADTFSFGSDGSPNGASLAVGDTCTVSIEVTAASGNTYTNTSGDLTSSLGNSGPASATLTVDASRLEFDMAFSPTTSSIGAPVSLAYTITNPTAAVVTSIAFSNTLPTGLEVATPSGATTDCSGGTVTANPGSSSISFAGGFMTSAGSCSVEVDVIGTSTGTFVNAASLSSSQGTSGFASDTLTVNAPSGDLTLVKQFNRTEAAPGGEIEMSYTLQNRSNDFAASSITFTDDLDAALSGLTATALPASGFCGPGSQLTGSSNLTLSGASLASRESCTFTVTLAVPAGAADGTVTSTSSAVSGDLEGTPVAGDPAAASFEVISTTPIMTKTFSGDPVAAGGSVTLEYVISNPSTTTTLSNIAFTDSTAAMANASVTSGTGSNVCGSGSFLFTQEISGVPSLVLSGGNLAASAQCTLTVTLAIPANSPAGDFASTSSEVTSDGGTGAPASDTLTVAAPALDVALVKTFTDDPVLPGDTVTLEFTLRNDDEASDITDLAFTDDLDAMLSGTTAVGLPASDVCGSGSTLSGTGTLALAGGNLTAGASCTFTVSVQVPGGAATGSYPNTTSDVSGDNGGGVVTATGTAASDTLVVSDAVAVTGTKSFTDDPVQAGEDVTLEFVLTNPNPSLDATGISFTDNLASLGLPSPGLTLSGSLPADPCGTGSALSLSGGTTGTLQLTGGNLLAGDSCTFSALFTVPAGAAATSYNSASSAIASTVNGNAQSGSAMADTLTVSSDFDNIAFSATFTDDPVDAGDTVTLQFVLDNSVNSSAIDSASFTDDLTQMGFAAIATPDSGTCAGTGSWSVTGTSTISASISNVPAGAVCTFDVAVDIPAGAPVGITSNTTSPVSVNIGANSGTVAAATDELTVSPTTVTFQKSITGGPAAPGDTLSVTYTILSPSSGGSLNDIRFTDDYDAILSGLAVTGSLPSDPCGAGSTLSGTSVLSLTGGSLAPSQTCQFSVDIAVPTSAPPDSYTSTTSDLFETSATIAAPASDTFDVSNPAENVTFALQFTNDPVFAGAAASATYTLTNPDTTSTVTDLGFSQDFDAVISGTTFSVDTNGCSGSLSAPTPGTLALSGASLAPGASCTLIIDLNVPSATSDADYTLTSGTLSGSVNGVSANAGTASDTLSVESAADVVFSKSFTDDPVAPGETVTLQYTIDNSGTGAGLSDLNFSENLDSVISGLAASGLPNNNVCGTGSSVSATGTGFQLTGGVLAAGAQCTFSVTVQVPGTAAPGNHVSTSSALLDGATQISAGVADTLVLSNPGDDVTFALAFTDDPVAQGGTATAQFTITNPDATVTTDGLNFTMAVDGVISGATVSGATPASPCGGATVTGGASLSMTGGTLAPGANCVFTVEISVPLSASSGTANFSTSALGVSVNGTATTVAAVSDGLIVGDAPQFTITPAGDFDTSGPVGGPFNDTQDYVITNTGTFPLDYSAAASQTFIGLSKTSGTIPAGGTDTVTVSITAVANGFTASPPDYTGTVTFTNLTDTGAPVETRDVTLSVQNQGSVTVVVNTMAGDGSFGFTSNNADLDGLTIVTSDGAGSASAVDVNVGTHTLTLPRSGMPEGFGLASISCTETGGASNSSVNVGAATATITVEANEAITCTFEAANSRERTTEVINRFLHRRVDMILSNEPGQNRRIDRLRNRFGGGASGTGTPFDVSGNQVGAGGVAMAFETSVSQIRAAYAAQDEAKQAMLATSGVFANNPSGMAAEETLWDVWFRGSVTWFDDNTGGTDSEGVFAIFHAGADYLVTDRILLGALVQLDVLDQDFTDLGANANGVGWMAGPYATVRLTENLYFDTRAAWGMSSNEISPFNTYTDDFTTTRWLVRAGLVGDWRVGGWAFRPSANLAYMEETQEGYTDQLDVYIPEQTVGVGQLDFGPEISYSYLSPTGLLIAPSAKLTGIWNFKRDTYGVTTTTSSAGVEMRAKAELGVNVRMPNGVRVEANGSYDGIGAEDYDAVTTRLKLSVPLN